MSESRPDPDALLAQVEQSEPSPRGGRLKVFLGMAAGVGKTYSMLNDGQEAKKRGQDVVIGYLEAHGRKETDDLAEGLARLPLKEIDYKGVILTEFDVDEAISRRPGLILVDELAHSNAPGSRHAKRWQDIVDLVDAGLNVETTVNIQHVESLRDVVAQITGVFVQETVPDAFFERATEIELVDLPPDELQQRLREGKVYIPEKVDQAIQGFFKKGNLLALRELALRHTAEKVDEELRKARTDTKVPEPWHASERILVCIAPNSLATKVVRAAKRLANSLHAEMVAVSVSSPRQGGLGPHRQGYVDEALRLAEDLGAKTSILSAEDIVGELMAFARRENVTTIVMGKPVRPRWKEMIFGSVVDHTVRASKDIDVLIITGDESSGTTLTAFRRGPRSRWQDYGEAVFWCGLATGFGFLMMGKFAEANLIMLYLAAVTIVALRCSRDAATLATLVSVGLFDFFFIRPRFSFAVSDAQYLFTFAVMLSVSLLIGRMTSRIKERTQAATERERNTAMLYDLSRKLAGTRQKTEMATFAVQKVDALVGVSAAVFRRTSEGELKVLAASQTGFEDDPKEVAVANWAVDHGRIAGSSTETLNAARGLYLPLIGSEGSFGALAIDLSSCGGLDTGRRHLLEAVASQLAVAMERAQFAKSSHQAALQAEGERMRGDLLSAVSHDLRTPLACIKGSASALLEQNGMSDTMQSLATTIVDESDRMARLVRNLLDMTRVQGHVDLNVDWQALDEIIGSAILRTSSLFEHPVEFKPAAMPIVVKVDGLLVEQVLVNLLENASRHGGREVNVKVSMGLTHGFAWMEVSDDGPGVPAKAAAHIFDRFRRGGLGGFGLGLAICKAAVEAHQGTISLLPGPKGAKFRIELPIHEEEPE